MKYRYVNQKIWNKQEVIDLIKSTIVISIAFTFLFTQEVKQFPLLFIVSIFTAGAGFILHELAHKFFAIKYGANAHYVSNDKGLLFTLLFVVLFKFLFAAPGAVRINGHLTKKQLGIISIAGPITNMFLAISFFLLALLIPIFVLGYSINAVLFAFNMIPIAPFDGQKVYYWNKTVYFIFAGIALLMYMSIFII